jgi:DtxR family Mn-dependent transcriptional regulator
LVLLSEAEQGKLYAVQSVYERDRKLLEFLEEKGIRPGARLKVEARNYDGTISLAIERRRVELGGPAAEKVWVAASR